MKKRTTSLLLALVICFCSVVSAAAVEFKPELAVGPESYGEPVNRETSVDVLMQMILLYCPELKDVKGSEPFEDCDNPRVLQAAALGLAGGVADNQFLPEGVLNRASAAVLITRAADQIKNNAGIDLLPNPAAGTEQFKDVKAGDFYAASVGRLLANGIMPGESETAFNPEGEISVQQFLDILAALNANGEKEEEPAGTEPAGTPAAPAAAGTAYASTQTVQVDGKPVEFQMYALKDANGNPTNYVKVRDVAFALNGTKAQFEVGYDNVAKAIDLIRGKAYTANGSEMSTPFSGDRAYAIPTGVTKVDGKVHSLVAIQLTSDSGGGFTYYKLRDLGMHLGFNVGWSKDTGVFIETDKPYQE